MAKITYHFYNGFPHSPKTIMPFNLQIANKNWQNHIKHFAFIEIDGQRYNREEFAGWMLITNGVC